MFWNFVVRAVRFRKRRLTLAFSALAVAATLATALFSVYTDIERKMRVQFRGYGANIVIAPAAGAQTVPLSAVDLAERQGAAAAPFLYTVGNVGGEPVVVAGVDFRRAAALTSYWRVEGARAAGPGECLAGSAAAAHLRLQIGARLELEGAPCTVRGIVSTGGAEDAQVMVPFAGAGASLVQVRADGERLPQIQAALAQALPGADVRLLHAVAETEANVVLKIRATLFLLTALILGVYLAKTMAGRERTEIARIDRQIDDEKARIRLLQAEVSHLEEPQRIERLSEAYLGMAPAPMKHQANLDELADIAHKPLALPANPVGPAPDPILIAAPQPASPLPAPTQVAAVGVRQ